MILFSDKVAVKRTVKARFKQLPNQLVDARLVLQTRWQGTSRRVPVEKETLLGQVARTTVQWRVDSLLLLLH